jgi:hypothetical protein
MLAGHRIPPERVATEGGRARAALKPRDNLARVRPQHSGACGKRCGRERINRPNVTRIPDNARMRDAATRFDRGGGARRDPFALASPTPPRVRCRASRGRAAAL